MKKTFYIFGVLMLIVLFAGCNNLSKTEGIDLPFTKYSLEGTTCKWMNLFDEENLGSVSESKLLVINSDEELKKYVEGDYPSIDFSEKTLLLAYWGWEGYIFNSYVQCFSQTSGLNYTLTVHVPPSALSVIGGWQAAIIVDKLPSESKIELNVIKKSGEIN